jgi:putative MATE family efflux protein
MTMGVVATVMVSPLGEFAISGVNVIDNINNLFIIAFVALSTGGAVVVSQYIGREDSFNASIASKQLIYIVILASFVITGIALAFREGVIRLIYGELDYDVMGAAMTFFLFSALSYPMLAIYSACAALFRSMGNSQTPMRVSLLMNLLHIALNVFFLHTLLLGVAGVALSMLLSRFVAAALVFALLAKARLSPISLSGIFALKLNLPMIRRILNIGLPTGLEQSMFMFGRLLTQRIFPFFGRSIIAANAIASVITSFTFMTGNAFGIALITVVGQCLGAGNIKAAKLETKKILKITWITIFILSGFTFIFSDFLTGLFNLSPEAHEAADLFLRIHSITLMVGWTLSFSLPNALRAAGDAKYVMLVAAISMWTVRVTAAYLLTFTLGMGPVGVWLAMAGDFLVRGFFYLRRWRSGRWESKKVIGE